VLVPVVSSVSLQEATENVRDLLLAQQARHERSSIPATDLRGWKISPRSTMQISGTPSTSQNQTTNPRPNLASNWSRRS